MTEMLKTMTETLKISDRNGSIKCRLSEFANFTILWRSTLRESWLGQPTLTRQAEVTGISQL